MFSARLKLVTDVAMVLSKCGEAECWQAFCNIPPREDLPIAYTKKSYDLFNKHEIYEFTVRQLRLPKYRVTHEAL